MVLLTVRGLHGTRHTRRLPIVAKSALMQQVLAPETQRTISWSQCVKPPAGSNGLSSDLKTAPWWQLELPFEGPPADPSWMALHHSSFEASYAVVVSKAPLLPCSQIPNPIPHSLDSNHDLLLLWHRSVELCFHCVVRNMTFATEAANQNSNKWMDGNRMQNNNKYFHPLMRMAPGDLFPVISIFR